MGSYEENYLAKRPQSLCKMCGKCCKVVTTPIPYSKLLQMAEDGDQGALDFLSVFVPYKSIDDAKIADNNIVENIIERLSQDGNFDVNGITFYYCKYLQSDNLCSNYANRPALCIHFPSTPWAIVPPECGFEGWLFMKREETKQKIRKVKEELIELQLLKRKKLSDETLAKIEAVEKKMYNSIELHKKHGSEFW